MVDSESCPKDKPYHIQKMLQIANIQCDYPHMKGVKIFLVLTRGGRHSSACLLRTENPPWVLVSEAVKVLQKEWTLHFSGSCGSGFGLVSSFC